MTVRRISVASAMVALLVLLAVGLVQLADRSPHGGTGGASADAAPVRLTLAQMRARLAGSPAPLDALHAQAGKLLPGDPRALQMRLAALRGHPVVINKWASWCGPCRSELGAFQRVSIAQGHEVAFIGIDSGEASRSDSLAFMREFPVSYPSYYDQSGRLGAAVTDSTFTPVTVFYDRRGGQYIHQGPYPSPAKLEQDVRRYALGV
jgi:cytochrome c biogenesis protein CcmG/thiol:disulfide interchange protein DsbE